MYARQHPRAGGILFVRTAGVLLLSLDLVSLAFWLGFGPFGLAPRIDPGFEWLFLLCGFIAAAGALSRRAFRVTIAAAMGHRVVWWARGRRSLVRSGGQRVQELT